MFSVARTSTQLVVTVEADFQSHHQPRVTTQLSVKQSEIVDAIEQAVINLHS